MPYIDTRTPEQIMSQADASTAAAMAQQRAAAAEREALEQRRSIRLRSPRILPDLDAEPRGEVRT